MRSKALLIALLFVLTTLAGCADGAKKGLDLKDEDFDDFDLDATEDSGVIRGVVVDPAIVPIGGVNVTLESTGQTVLTTEKGAFGFSGVEPGAHFLTASKAGFETVQQSIEVVAGVDLPDVVKILLDPDPSTAPYTETIQFNGLIVCSFALGALSIAACGLNPVASATGNVFLQEHQYATVPEHVQSEMIWDATQVTGESLQLSWTDPNDGAQVRIAAERGSSPLIVQFDRETFEELNLTGKTLWMRIFSSAVESTDPVEEDTWNGPWASTVYPSINGTPVQDVGAAFGGHCEPVAGFCTVDPLREECVGWFILFAGCLGWGGLGAALDQDYEVFTTNFYNFQPRDGWTFVADGPHPVPT